MAHAQRERHGFTAFQPHDTAPVWQSAHGEFVRSVDGDEYIDMVMGHGAALWGHGTVTERIMQRYSADVLANGLGSSHTTDLRVRALDKLVDWAGHRWPGAMNLQAAILYTGAEAVETAIKTAIAATGRPGIVAFKGAYHGAFGMAAAATDGEEYTKAFSGAQRFPGARHCPYGEVPELDELTACVIVEPVQGNQGVQFPPAGFLHGLRVECDRVGAKLILDDVLAGAGRTGVPIEGISCDPDILVLAKAIAGGMIGSAVICSDELAESAWGGDDSPKLGTTYYGHPLSCAAILEVLQLHDDHDIGSLAEKFAPAMQHIADETGLTVRGTGAFWALDTGEENGGSQLAEALLEQRIITTPSGAKSECVNLMPPLLMTDSGLERFVEAAVQCGCARSGNSA
jgi:acetylornithine/succinyldiaminopimelate/putrescine aminotransferase